MNSESKRTGPISLGDENAVKKLLVDTVFSLWDVVNNLTRIKPAKHERYRVTIFGSARTKPGTFVYEEVKRIATVLSELECDVITGGGPGVMQAANEGAAIAKRGSVSMGIRVELPFEQEVNPFVTEAYEHKTFFTRLHHFVLASDAFIVAPGGVGTVLELMMIWQLLQVKHLRQTPLILVGPMWKGLVDWAKQFLLRPEMPLANPEDMEIPRCVDGANDAIALIRLEHAKWSQRDGGGSA
ncbi:MAG: LOG family protein [Gemmataceae bacterium]